MAETSSFPQLQSATQSASLYLSATTEPLPDTRSTLIKAAGFLPSYLIKIISFATISLPLFFYRILTWSFTVHLNFSSLLVIVGVTLMAAYLVVRYRFLTIYSRLKPIEPPKSTSSFDLLPDSPEDSAYSNQGFKNYPDEFLSAFLFSIKIFGYLEQPVFHELARHLQTKKLLAGDTLFRNEEQEKSFYIVVDGHVQLFVKPEDEERDDSSVGSHDHDDLDGSSWRNSFHTEDQREDRFKNYTLINEVSGGGTLSSLFTILSIFRESMKRSQEKEQRRKATRGRKLSHSSLSQTGLQDPASRRQRTLWSRHIAQDDQHRVFPNIQSNTDLVTPPSDASSTPGTTAAPHANTSPREPVGSRSTPAKRENAFPSHLQPSSDKSPEDDEISHILHAPVDPFLGEPVNPDIPLPHEGVEPHMDPYSQQRRAYRHTSVHPNIIARATTDTTLAVIPAQAFHKLFQNFPRAAAHMVQVIVTRFHRVTLSTSHDYLGLTKELLQMEQRIHESVSLPELPRDFGPPGAIARLRRKIAVAETAKDQHKSKGEDVMMESQLPVTPTRLTEKDGLMRTDHLQEDGTEPSTQPVPSGDSPTTVTRNAMDLLQDARSPPHHFEPSKCMNEEYSVEDDLQLRASVMHTLSQLIGVPTEQEGSHTPSSFQMSPRTHRKWSAQDSAHSGRYYPMDLFSHSGTVDSSGSPSLSALSVQHDDDVDAVSTVSSAYSGSDAQGSEATKNDLLSSNDLQILFYRKGDALIKEHETGPGLFFVIDGLLEVTMTAGGAHDLLGQATIENHRQSHSSKKAGKQGRFSLSPSSSVSSLTAEESSTRSPSESSQAEAMGITPVPFEFEQKYGQTLASVAPAGRTQPNDSAKKRNPSNKKRPTFYIKPGGVAGYLSALTGYASFIEISAKTDTCVGFLSKKSLDRIIDKNPSVMLKLASHLVGALDPLILQIDIALEWLQVPAGKVLYAEGQPSDSIYMVMHGRLRTIREKKEGDLEIISEFGRGDTVGELEVLTGMEAPFTLHAIRDSEIARMPKTLFNALALQHPEIMLQISRMIAYRSIQLVTQKNSGNGQQGNVIRFPSHGNNPSTIASISSSVSPGRFPEVYGRNNVNLKTIGILPVNSAVPVIDFAEHLKSALVHSVGASCILLNSATVTSVIGKYAFTRLGKLKLASWLAEQEEKYRIVLYLADSGITSQWIRTCIRQADCILLIGLGDGDPAVGEYERLLINMKTTARKELVLLHRERFCASGTTEAWKKNRLWIQAHHHVYMPMRQSTTLATERFAPPWLGEKGRKMTSGSINVLTNVRDQLEKYYSAVPTFGRLLVVKKERSDPLGGVSTSARNDFARLARRLCGKSVALVLGGGGAKGISHIGLIQALEEAGIPIDIIGGTSIGSFVGGLYAKDMDLVATIARAKMFSSRMSSLWRQIMDLTYPVTAWFTGHEFNRSIFKCFGESQIEDFWLPYFAVTTNITYSRMEVHTTGYAWRYIRASMSLSGYMPPICDNGNMLVDGGYVDNLPVSVAKNMGADIIIAVDVQTDDDTSPVYYGDSISGWWALLHSFNPFRTYNIPSIAEIQSRLAYVSSVAKLEEAKIIDGTLYVKLPVQTWGTLEFNKFNDIMQLGYMVGREVVNRWRGPGYASGVLASEQGEKSLRGKQVKGKRGRRNSI